jgi:hypothetical protein
MNDDNHKFMMMSPTVLCAPYHDCQLNNLLTFTTECDKMAAYSYNHTLVKEYAFTKLSSQSLYLTILLHQVKIIYFKDPAATRAIVIYLF